MVTDWKTISAAFRVTAVVAPGLHLNRVLASERRRCEIDGDGQLVT
jgi:hypothetical protein